MRYELMVPMQRSIDIYISPSPSVRCAVSIFNPYTAHLHTAMLCPTLRSATQLQHQQCMLQSLHCTFTYSNALPYTALRNSIAAPAVHASIPTLHIYIQQSLHCAPQLNCSTSLHASIPTQGRIQEIEKGGSRVMRAKRAKNFALATPTFG